MRDAKTQMEKVQFELNLKIIDIELNSQPSTPLETKEQCEATVKDVVATIDVAVADCIVLFKQSMDVITTLQEDPNLHNLKKEAAKL